MDLWSGNLNATRTLRRLSPSVYKPGPVGPSPAISATRYSACVSAAFEQFVEAIFQGVFSGVSPGKRTGRYRVFFADLTVCVNEFNLRRLHSNSRKLWKYKDLFRQFASLSYSIERTARGRRCYRSPAEARVDIFDYIERFSNPNRRRRITALEVAKQPLTQQSVEMG